jgi:hypothetical protein
MSALLHWLPRITLRLYSSYGIAALWSRVAGWVAMHECGWERARDVQQALTEAGQHRSAGAADLLIAATAERERLVILCDDRDYLGIAARHGPARQDHHRDLIERYRFLSPGGQVYLIDGLCRRENQERARDRTG